MPSKKSKPQNTPSLWKRVSDCSEAELVALAGELARELRLGDRVLLEGPLGAGKTTFARALLVALGVLQPPEGSPSFAIAHEYTCPQGDVVHLDFYRLKHESEIEDAGISAYFWERDAIVISEWITLFPEFQTSVLRSGRAWYVRLAFGKTPETTREIQITRIQ